MDEKQVNWGISRVDNTWNKYNMREEYLTRDGKDTGCKSIVKDDANVAILKEDYKLLPNEEMVAVADDVATLLGAVPFDKFTGDWFCRTDKHVFLTGENKAQGHALYSFNQPVDIGGGDMINIGFALHNSIDGSMGFSVGTYTFRHQCSNMVFMGYRGKGMKFDDREVLAHVYKKHSKNLDIDRVALANIVKAVVAKGQDILEQYRQWKNEELKIDIAKRLVKRLPKKYIPEYISVTEAEMLDGTVQTKVELLKAPTIWETYNDITQVIWHNSDTQYSSKKGQFDSLHQALKLKLGGKIEEESD